MVKINNLLNNSNISVLEEIGGIKILEHQKEISPNLEECQALYYASQMNVRKRQALLELNNSSYIISSGAMQWFAGDIKMKSDVKGVGDFIGKTFKGSVTNESAVKPLYKGTGTLMLEPTYKHLLIEDLSEWDGQLVIEDGMFKACDGDINTKVVSRKTLSSLLAKEGLFNLMLEGKGYVVLESPVSREELIEVELCDDIIRIDGNYAICWSNTLELTVETSSKSLVGSAISGEGLVNVYKGSGKILMSPLI